MEKKDSLSIEGQITLCRKQAGGEVRIFQDKGYSAKNTNRPEFQKLMQEVARGSIQKIIVYRLDRFSRSTSDFGRLWETLQSNNVEFVSVSEAFDTSTPMGRAMLNIIMVFAQLERETTAERVRDNYYQRIRLGAWPGGPAPYGFDIGRAPDASGKAMPTLVANAHMEVIQRIFFSYAAEEASLGSVARALNEAGISAPKRATWDNVTLSRILHNPAYVMADEDIYLYYKSRGVKLSHSIEAFDGLHAGILVGKRARSQNKCADLYDQHFSMANHFGAIPSGLWLSCQVKLDRNRQIGQGGKGKHTWLSGRLKCAQCGYSVKINKDKEKYYLICSGRANLSQCQASISVDLRELESVVEAELLRLLEACPPIIGLDREEAREISGALRRIEEKAERLMAALAEGTELSMRYINRELERLDREREALLERQDTQCGKGYRRDLHKIDFRHLHLEEKKLVSSQFIDRIDLHKDSAVIRWNV